MSCIITLKTPALMRFPHLLFSHRFMFSLRHVPNTVIWRVCDLPSLYACLMLNAEGKHVTPFLELAKLPSYLCLSIDTFS